MAFRHLKETGECDSDVLSHGCGLVYLCVCWQTRWQCHVQEAHTKLWRDIRWCFVCTHIAQLFCLWRSLATHMTTPDGDGTESVVGIALQKTNSFVWSRNSCFLKEVHVCSTLTTATTLSFFGRLVPSCACHLVLKMQVGNVAQCPLYAFPFSSLSLQWWNNMPAFPPRQQQETLELPFNSLVSFCQHPSA